MVLGRLDAPSKKKFSIRSASAFSKAKSAKAKPSASTPRTARSNFQEHRLPSLYAQRICNPRQHSPADRMSRWGHRPQPCVPYLFAKATYIDAKNRALAFESR